MLIRRVFLGCLATGILAFAALTSTQAQAPSTLLLIRGATIIDGISDAPLRDRALLIDGNTIRDTLAADAPAPVGAQVLDLSGKFIIPGLFDSHVHWEPFMGELLVNHGVTSILALDNVPKALRTRSSRSSTALPYWSSSAIQPELLRSRHQSNDSDLAPIRT
jgi:predicted amidohydrolase YtcJ